jgi:hypothetical protein
MDERGYLFPRVSAVGRFLSLNSQFWVPAIGKAGARVGTGRAVAQGGSARACGK